MFFNVTMLLSWHSLIGHFTSERSIITFHCSETETRLRPRKNHPKTAAKLDIPVQVVKLEKLVYELELLTQMKDISWLKIQITILTVILTPFCNLKRYFTILDVIYTFPKET